MYIFDENDVFFRSPCGAIRAPGTLTLSMKLKRGEALNPRVQIYPDGGEKQELAMEYDHVTGTFDVYKSVLKIDTPGLYWYNFLIDSTHGTTFFVPEHPG